MADIRKRVEEDRGIIKRIELFIPGFRGYRKREDLRQADSILRIQLADRLKDIRTKVEDARQILTENSQLKALEPIGRSIMEMQELEGLIRHADQGYSGISWAIRIEEEELNKLYEFDLSLLEGLAALDKKAASLGDAAGDSVKTVREVSVSVAEIRTKFKNRVAFITQTEVG